MIVTDDGWDGYTVFTPETIAELLDSATERCECGTEHQPRERSVPCRLCSRPTLDPHALHPSCSTLLNRNEN